MKIGYIRVKNSVLPLLFSLLTAVIYSQERPSHPNFWNKVQFGGGLGLGFGNNSFNALVSPSAIYSATDQFSTGVGLNFNYSKFRNARLLAYGGSIINYYNPIPTIQLSAELEQLRINNRIRTGGLHYDNDYWSPALFVGVGYSMPNIIMGVRYNLLHDSQKSIYANALMPFVRVYF